MKTRNRSLPASWALATQFGEMALAVPLVVSHRLARMALAGNRPTTRDLREFERMGSEKWAALTEASIAVALQAWQVQQQLALAALQAWSWPALGRKPRRTAAASRPLREAAADLMRRGLAPVHRRAVANARRLGRTRLRPD